MIKLNDRMGTDAAGRTPRATFADRCKQCASCKFIKVCKDRARQEDSCGKYRAETLTCAQLYYQKKVYDHIRIFWMYRYVSPFLRESWYIETSTKQTNPAG